MTATGAFERLLAAFARTTQRRSHTGQAISAKVPRSAVTYRRLTQERIARGLEAHCDAYIGLRMQTLVKLGVTKAEVEETLAMTRYIDGGPSLT